MTQTGTMTTVEPPIGSPEFLVSGSAFHNSRQSLEAAAKELRGRVKQHAEEAVTLHVRLHDERRELKRTERLLAAVERIENPRSRKGGPPGVKSS